MMFNSLSYHRLLSGTQGDILKIAPGSLIFCRETLSLISALQTTKFRDDKLSSMLYPNDLTIHDELFARVSTKQDEFEQAIDPARGWRGMLEALRGTPLASNTPATTSAQLRQMNTESAIAAAQNLAPWRAERSAAE
jgi:hypothetical protein